MNIVQSPDQNQVKEVILHYKKFYLSVGIILLCFVLIVYFILPLVQQYMDQRQEVQEVEDRITILKQNISLESGINEQDQSDQLATTIKALPQEKDYAGILYAIKTASSKTNISTGDFSFSVGDLTPKSVIGTRTPFISMNLNLVGDPKDVARFLTELSQTLPLSNVSEVHLSNRASTVVVVFYYKPVPQLRINYEQPIPNLSANHIALLKTLTSWKSSGATFDFIPVDESSSSSAQFAY